MLDQMGDLVVPPVFGLHDEYGHYRVEIERNAKAEANPSGEMPAQNITADASQPVPLYTEVSSIDTVGRTWTHKNKDGKEVKFFVTSKTDITNNRATAQFDDIKVGDWVSGLRLKKNDTEYEVIKITKFGPKTDKPATPIKLP